MPLKISYATKSEICLWQSKNVMSVMSVMSVNVGKCHYVSNIQGVGNETKSTGDPPGV